jgi:hypothetical protein
MGNVRWSVLPGTAVASSNTKATCIQVRYLYTACGLLEPAEFTLDLVQPSHPSANASSSERNE